MFHGIFKTGGIGEIGLTNNLLQLVDFNDKLDLPGKAIRGCHGYFLY
jgi:hypothetical protein